MNASSICLVGAIAIVAMASTAAAQSPPSPDGGAPADRYTYTATSVTVTDTKTGLIWQRTTPPTLMTQPNAKAYCGSAALATSLEGAGWRLPTMKELLTLVDYAQSTAPMIDRAAFPETPSGPSWSSSPVAGSPSSAWIVNFGYGSTGANDMANASYVRCVR